MFLTCFRKLNCWDASQSQLLLIRLQIFGIALVSYLRMWYIVGLLSQFMHKSRMVHWKGTLCVLTYVKNALGKGLVYKRHEHLCIEAYSDSSYIGDKRDRKSTFGYCIYIEGNFVTGRSKKKNVVSRSGAEIRIQVHDTNDM